MPEPVAALLRESLRHLAAETPSGHRRLAEVLGPLRVEVDVDGEVFDLRGGDTVTVGVGGPADVRIATSRRAICAVLDAETSVAAAVDAHRIRVLGALDNVLRAYDALGAYVHAAVRAPSTANLPDRLRQDVS